ncbi:hypothetical protein CMU89_18035 [Elizabethkingia anophelis]|nr:hypothetical protein [Elizabethkingia anophelis]MDV3544534.1 hypothetical protein [Elizabethkingia anophelis]
MSYKKNMIFHYTSIETLELIIKNKTIRFTRFDQLDDQTETEGLPEMLKKSYFLSCWVNEEKENIPQWVMYAEKGVRIEFPEKWYKKHSIPIENKDASIAEFSFLDENHPAKKMFFILPFEKLNDKDGNYYFVPPMNEKDGLVVEVEYCHNFSERKRECWDFNNNRIGLTHLDAPIKFKDDYWSFQKEIRYFLMCNSSYENRHNIPNFIDVPINEDIFNKIKIRLHPNCTSEYQKKVEQIINNYLPNLDITSHIERSLLDGKYKQKK